MIRFKQLSLILLGATMGGIIVAWLMFSQINNRYEMGLNSGYIQGGSNVIRFIQTHLRNDLEGKNITELNQYLDHKASRVSVITINGIKTLKVE